MTVDLNKLLSDVIEMNNQVFLQHRYAKADPDCEARAAELGRLLASIDPDGTLSQQVQAACSAFIADELRKHPAGSIDPYEGLGPEPFTEPMTPEEIQALDPEDVFGVVGEMLERKVSEGHELSDPEQTVYLLYVFDSEMQNGGFEQFLMNSAGKYLPSVFRALEEVKARKYASLLRALAAPLHPDEKEPADTSCLSPEAKAGMLAALDPQQTNSFDGQYYSYYSRTPLSRIVGRFILRHRVFGSDTMNP